MKKRLLLVLLLTALGSLGGCGSKGVDSSVNEQVSKGDSDLPPLDRRFYKGCTTDLVDLRKTRKLPNQPERRASTESAHAAARIFKRIDFVAMTKKEVLSLLGDPATVNDYGIAEKPGDNSPLVYRIDTGLGGLQYTLEFKNGKVQKLKVEGLY